MAGAMQLEFARMDVLLHPLVTSDTRQVHGLELFVYGNDHFAAGNEAIHTLRLPCGANHFAVTHSAMDFALRPAGPHMWPTAALSFVLMARHCKSDRGDEVCHNCGYGSVTVQELASGAERITVRLVDRPGEFELLYATDNQAQPDNASLVSVAREVRQHAGHEFYDRGTIVFSGARVHLPVGMHTRWPIRAPVMLDNDPASWDFMGAANKTHADAVRRAIQRIMETHKNRTYEPYGGTGLFRGWRALNEMWRGYFVPTYRLTCGIDMPSGLVMMGTQFDRVPHERLYSQLFRVHIACNSITADQFVHACKSVLTLHWKWAMQCRQEPPADLPDFWTEGANELTWLDLLVLCIISRSLSALPNALCYTTDFAEMREGRRQGVKEIVTEQPEMAPMLTRSLDCEDGAMWIHRLYMSLVQNQRRWQDPVVHWAARVLDLYLVRIDVMHCGECHIMSKLELRERAYRKMMAGVQVLQDAALLDEGELLRLRRTVHSTAFWHDSMYPGGRHERAQCMDVVQGHEDTRFDEYPIPGVLYAEPTRASHPNQSPYDVNVVQGDTRGTAARQHARLVQTCVAELCSRGTQELRNWEAVLLNASDMSRDQCMQRPLDHSPFYKASLIAHYPCVALHLLRRDLDECRGQETIQTPLLDEYLERHLPFADVVHHDRAHPSTFGVYSAHEVCNASSLCAVPYAFLSREAIVCTGMVLDCEPPVLPSDPPASTDGLPVEQFGQSEPLPQFLAHDEQLRAYALKEDDMPYTLVRFLPHDRAIDGERFVRHLSQCDARLVQGGVHCRRYPLAQASIRQTHPWSPQELATVRAVLEPLGLWDQDPVMFLGLLKKGQLQELARNRARHHQPHEYDTARHWMGERVRTRPVYLKVVDVHCDTL